MSDKKKIKKPNVQNAPTKKKNIPERSINPTSVAAFLSRLKTGIDVSSDAIVVLSGGQDSVTCLMLAQMLHKYVKAIHFKYGQRHALETEAARDICKKVNVELTEVDVPFFSENISSALVDDSDISKQHAYKTNLPASFVPGRNALFLTIAHAFAQEHKADVIYTGVCQTDYSGYPDCRASFINLLEHTLNEGYETRIKIKTPLMYINKADTFALAKALNFLDIIIDKSITCYNGDQIVNPWGKGCGECPACNLRVKGYQSFLSGDHHF